MTHAGEVNQITVTPELTHTCPQSHTASTELGVAYTYNTPAQAPSRFKTDPLDRYKTIRAHCELNPVNGARNIVSMNIEEKLPNDACEQNFSTFTPTAAS